MFVNLRPFLPSFPMQLLPLCDFLSIACSHFISSSLCQYFCTLALRMP